MAITRCPKDGESLAWHLFVHDTTGEGKLLTNGDLIGCDFGKEEIEESLNDQNRSGALETSP